MKWSLEMQKPIEAIAKKQGIDLYTVQPGDLCIKIKVKGYMELVIEKIAKNQISVAHYFEQNGDLCVDPEIVFLIAPGYDRDYKKVTRWYPISFGQPPIMGGIASLNFSGYEEYVVEWDNKGNPARYYARRQADCATFSNMWGRNLRAQGFVKAA